MGRTFVDADLRVWEVFASAARFPGRPRIVFLCRTDPTLRARILERDGDHAEAERAVASASTEQLLEWLEASRVID